MTYIPALSRQTWLSNPCGVERPLVGIVQYTRTEPVQTFQRSDLNMFKAYVRKPNNQKEENEYPGTLSIVDISNRLVSLWVRFRTMSEHVLCFTSDIPSATTTSYAKEKLALCWRGWPCYIPEE